MWWWLTDLNSKSQKPRRLYLLTQYLCLLGRLDVAKRAEVRACGRTLSFRPRKGLLRLGFENLDAVLPLLAYTARTKS